MLTQIKNTLYAGIYFSCVSCIIWLLLSRGGSKIAVGLLIAAVVVFLLNLLIDTCSGKCSTAIKIAVKAAGIVLTCVIFFAFSIAVIAQAMLFSPHFDQESYETLQARDNVEEISFSTDNGEISGWRYHKEEDASVPTVVYFCGNGENASTKMCRITEMSAEENPFEHCNFIFFDYPGYGKSSGSPSEASLKQYGLDVYDWTKEQYPDSEVIVMGYSLGTGVANYVASKRQTDGLILLAPYADGYDLYNSQIGIFHGPMRLLVTYRMEAVRFAESVQGIPLILASKQDEMVPIESSMRFFDAYPDGCKFITLDGVTHNNFLENQEVIEQIRNYIKEVQR